MNTGLFFASQFVCSRCMPYEWASSIANVFYGLGTLHPFVSSAMPHYWTMRREPLGVIMTPITDFVSQQFPASPELRNASCRTVRSGTHSNSKTWWVEDLSYLKKLPDSSGRCQTQTMLRQANKSEPSFGVRVNVLVLRAAFRNEDVELK